VRPGRRSDSSASSWCKGLSPRVAGATQLYRIPYITDLSHLPADRPATTQEARKAETRALLVAAAAELFATRGIDGVSVDAVAEQAGRTSGAVYAHFAGKQGLLLAVLDAWVSRASAAIAAESHDASTAAERVEALASGFTRYAEGDGATWLLLEHELLLRAARDDGVRAAVAARYAEGRSRLGTGLATPGAGEAVAPAAPGDQLGALVLALLLGLELQRRLDPDAVPADLARAGLAALLGIHEQPPTKRSTRAHTTV
jgi:AcrR family transcriptional regulator